MRIASSLLLIAVMGCASASNRALATPAAPQQQAAPACLHGDNEAPEQRARRVAALTLTRDVNTTQATAVSTRGGYQPLPSLTLNRPTPEGFRLQLSTDGTSYAFSVKDTLDPCLFAFFSDQSGIILVGQAIQ